jgi:hypothetical protein
LVHRVSIAANKWSDENGAIVRTAAFGTPVQIAEKFTENFPPDGHQKVDRLTETLCV